MAAESDGLHKDESVAAESDGLHKDAPVAHDAPPHDPVAHASELTAPATPASPDRVYRSGAGMAGGVLLLALIAWLGIDALVRGQGHTPWLALATMLLLVPLVSAFTLRPAVFANDERLRVRNPLRTITLPWAAVAALRAGYSNEVLDQAGTKYQLWAIPVSLRARKRASRAELRARSANSRPSGGLFGGSRSRTLPGAFGGGTPGQSSGVRDLEPSRATADRSMDDLRELVETRAAAPAAQGEPEVRWCYEVLAPALAGLVLLAVLLGVG
ncbi:PH domain-containing protein [Streptomyces odontomachi]|uniref:PH domain-containing protein n=1 Tax=Streptomyces odontomachi TaxID=2944940 RepID=UPI0035A83469